MDTPSMFMWTLYCRLYYSINTMLNLMIAVVLLCGISTDESEENFMQFHLKPFGSHIPPSSVDEVTEESMLTPNQFMSNYVLPRKPLVLRGVVKQWPAYKKWTDTYLRESYPNLELRMEGRKEKRTPIPQGDIALGRDSLKHFIDTYHESGVNKYVVSELPTPLYKYINIPKPLGCGELRNRFTEINWWVNSGGAQSILHKDSPNTINCVVNGSKEWKLVEFQYNHLIYQAWEGPQEVGYGGYSLINPEKVDLKRFPEIARIPRWFYTHIKAGDCLYLPSQMWHIVHSHGNQNMAVAFLLSQFQDTAIEDLDVGECGDELGDSVSLDQIDVDWQYPGYGKMTMGYSDIVDYMPLMEKFFTPKDKVLSSKRIYSLLYNFYDGAPHQRERAENRTLGLYKAMNNMLPEHSIKFTLPMLKNLSRNQLREIIFYIEAHYPAGTLEHEYSFFTPEQLIQICRTLAQQNDGLLRKEDFIKAYLDENGSLKFAEQFWDKLTGEKAIVGIEKIEKYFGKATELYEFYRDQPLEEDDPEDDRNQVPESDFVSSPKSMKADFYDDATDVQTLKRKVNQKEQNHIKSEL